MGLFASLRQSRGLAVCCAAVVALSLNPASSLADDINGTGWKGTGGSQNWSYYTNWDSSDPSQGERNLFFGNAWNSSGKGGQTTAYNDLTGYSGYGITFQDNGFGNNTTFTLTGNSITQYDFSSNSPFVTNNSYLLQNDNLNTTFQSSTGNAYINDTNGSINMGGTVAMSSGTTLNLTGASGGTTTFAAAVTNPTAIAITDNLNVTFSGGISGSGTLTKAGSGVLLLNGTNTYSAPITVSAGTLAGGTTSAPAQIAGTVTLNSSSATISAGTGATASDTIGTLSTGSQNLSSGTYAVKVGVSGSSDTLIMTGLTSIGSGFVIDAIKTNSTTFTTGNTYTWVIADATGSGNASAFNSYLTALQTNLTSNFASAGQLSLSTAADAGGSSGTGEDLVLSFNDSPAAPEPTSALLFAATASPLLLARRRQRTILLTTVG